MPIICKIHEKYNIQDVCPGKIRDLELKLSLKTNITRDVTGRGNGAWNLNIYATIHLYKSPEFWKSTLK